MAPSEASSGTGRRYKGALLSVGLVGAVLVGIGVWRGSVDPPVDVPDSVCGLDLPGSAVEPLLPERGDAFEQSDFTFHPDRLGSVPQSCVLSAAGEQVRLGVQTILFTDDFDRAAAARKAELPGHAPVRLGDALGDSHANSVSLYVPCLTGDGKENLLAFTVGVSGDGTLRQRGLVPRTAALTADLARNLAPRAKDCKVKNALPSGPPSTG
ncbi:hypothetical protein ACIQM4_17470 [Streptomyces sp. NPDC091272]|uniref:hypothetical protein n=1 Tax=Streptomyces sp. NPDC091272 TaxID=3365981 RepID=UPI00382099E9